MLINASAFEIFFPIQLSRAHDEENQFKILSLWNMISEWYQATSNSGEIDSGQDKDWARDGSYSNFTHQPSDLAATWISSRHLIKM